MTIPSPCISVCVTDPGSDLCYGCARTTPEIAKWSKFTDEEKKQVIEISRSRMSGWQLEAFDKAYKEILENYKIETNKVSANFLLLDFDNCKYSAIKIKKSLEKKGILLRSLEAYKIKNKLRLTIGNTRENILLLKTLEKIFRK